MKSITLLDKISKGSLLASVVLLPLWVLPVTQNIIVYQKQALLVLLVFLGLVSWLAKAVNQGEMRWRSSIVYVPVALLVLGFGLSVLFSKWVAGSFWGFPLDLSDNFLTLVTFALFSFLAFQAVDNAKHVFKLLTALVLSFGLASLYALLQAAGVHVLFFDLTQSPSFNTIGGMNAVAVLAAALLPLSLVLGAIAKLLSKWAIWAASLVFLAVLVVVNFSPAWIALLAGLLVLLAFGMWNMRRKAEFHWASFPMALLVVAVFFLVFGFQVPFPSQNLPVEISPSQRATFEIAKSVVQESPLFGSGPGTFALVYSEHRPAELNQTVFFNTRFSSGASEALDWLTTKGVVGLILLLALWGTLKVAGAKALLKKESGGFTWMLGLGSFASFVAIIVSQLLYPSSFLLWFLFWVLVAVVAFVAAKEAKFLTISTHPFLALASSFSFLLILIFGLGLLFIGGQKYAAEVQYLQGARAGAQGNLDLAIEKVLSAAQLNPAADLYWRDLAQLYLAQVNSIGAREGLTQELRQELTQAAVSNAIASVQSATNTAPSNVANWNVRGLIYRSLVGLEGAKARAEEAYLRAAELEPNSPFPLTELGRVNIVLAQSLAQQQGGSQERELALTTALAHLEKALELKPDYAPANYLTAVVYEQQGRSDEAIARLVQTKAIAPNDVGLAFQLGVVYWQQKQLSLAQAELERALSLQADYSNARYILGLVYDAQGETALAVSQFESLRDLNSDNEEVAQILSNLENGLPALDGINVNDPPIQETPPEIQNPTEGE